jgi:GTP cyclohydrolase I
MSLKMDEMMLVNGNGNGSVDKASSPALAEASTQEIYTELLTRLGEDPTRDGLLKTPERVEKSMDFLTQGYTQSVEEVLHDALFDVDYDEMVMVRDIEFYSMC